MRESEKKVGRADHNLEGARSVAADQLIDTATGNTGPTGDNPDRKAHGTHGRGRDQEKVQEDAPIEPDNARGSDRGSASWGSEGSGGSVVDKRSGQDR